MWQKLSKYKAGFFLGAVLAAIGLLLQAAFGGIRWELLAFPLNLVSLLLLLIILTVLHLFRKRTHIISWLGSIPSAVTSLGWAAVCTVVMGLVKQRPSGCLSSDFPGFDRMVSNWSFSLIYFWLVVSLGLTIFRVCFPLRIKRLPFLLNHLGLFTALVCGVLGSADMQKLEMAAEVGRTEFHATNEDGTVTELPLAVELLSFNIKEYSPRLMLVDGNSGKALPEGKPESPVLDSLTAVTGLCGWSICILDILDNAVPVEVSDSIAYVKSSSRGGCTAVLASVSKPGKETVTGWISCGSFLYPGHPLKVEDNLFVVMPEREPQRFISTVRVSTSSGKTVKDSILVNKPLRIDGWKIYQLSYDRSKGRWSETSVFELVRDPWMPAVYVGICMMVLGAVCMFIQFGRKRKEGEK